MPAIPEFIIIPQSFHMHSPVCESAERSAKTIFDVGKYKSKIIFSYTCNLEKARNMNFISRREFSALICILVR
jgi:hypothetical protein